MKFVDNSEAVKRELERAAIRGLTKAAMLVESQAVLLVPVNTGGLRGSSTAVSSHFSCAGLG